MNIAVTGGSGFVGRRLVDRLARDGHHVVSLDISTGVDVTDWNQVQATPPVDYVFHLAARTFVPEAFSHPQMFYRTNFLATLHTLELCRRDQARFVYASSFVYGRPAYLPIDEQHPLNAHNPYAQSKLIGEDLFRAYARDFSVKGFILRPFNIYGHGQPDSFLIPTIIRQARTGCIRLQDPLPKRDFIHVGDVISAYVACLSHDVDGVEAVNIASGRSLSVDEVARTIAACMGGAEVLFSGEQRPNEVLDTVADIRKAKSLLGWAPTISFERGVRACMDGMDVCAT